MNPSEIAGERIIVREINESDHEALAPFLAQGFGYRPVFYSSLLEKLRRRDPPDGFPRYGYMLQKGSRIVGSIFLIFSRIEDGGSSSIRCHVTSWCVDPEYRPMASLFFNRGLKRTDVTYINVSARPWTMPIIEKQGFQKYANGQFVMSTMINAMTGPRANHAKVLDGQVAVAASCSAFDRQLLIDHAGYGCIAVWCVEGGVAYPFVFHERPFKGFIPGVQLVYCHSIENFARFARPLGRYLAARSKMIVRADANGTVPHLVGKYFDGMDPRFAKGAPPRLGDLAYTQMVMCPFTRAETAGSRDDD